MATTMEPAETAAAVLHPPAPAVVASPKKQSAPRSPPQTGEKTDTEISPSAPVAASAKSDDKPKKPRNKKPQHPKKDGATKSAAEEGKADKPKSAEDGGESKSEKKAKSKKPHQPKKDGAAKAAAEEAKAEAPKDGNDAAEKKPNKKGPKPHQNKKIDGGAPENKNDEGQTEHKKKNHKNKNKDAKPNAANEEGKPKVRTVKGKNTEVFEPSTKPVDLRITYDLGSARDRFSASLTSRDVLLAPNVFNDFKPGELYAKLLAELNGCGIPEERLLKMWHGNEKIDGTHLIVDDRSRWKANCPTFQLVIDRVAEFFSLKVQATRFNWYKDTSQWKPFHFDAAAVKPEIAAKQNFTVAVSFGATRDAAFEHAKTRTVVSVPQPDGCVYAFARDTNVIWRHGILQDAPVRQEGRISVIAWGWIDGMTDAPDAVSVAPVTEQKQLKQHK